MSAEKGNLEHLELNRETIQDLSEGESEAAGGGLIIMPPSAQVRNTCYCINTQQCPTQPVETVKCTYGDSCTCISWRNC